MMMLSHLCAAVVAALFACPTDATSAPLALGVPLAKGTPPPPPVSLLEPGAFRVRCRGNNGYLYEPSKYEAWLFWSRFIRITHFLPATDTRSHFKFHSVAAVPGWYKARVVASGRFINEQVPGNQKISTPLLWAYGDSDDRVLFRFVEMCDGTVAIESKVSAEHLRADADNYVSTRYTSSGSLGDLQRRFYLEPLDVEPLLPPLWETMEIEAKWRISSWTFNSMMAAFVDGAAYTVGGTTYTLNVRWGGISRKYVDDYYDASGEPLAAGQHSYRHRTRSTSDPTAPGNSWAALEAASWEKDWEKVQYKSTPWRLDAVWLRREDGACRIWPPGSCPPPTDLASVVGGSPTHPANGALLVDHPGFDFTTMAVKTKVTDYRYRIELYESGAVDPSFEVSLDQLETRTHTDGFATGTKSYEAELEIVKSGFTIDDVRELFQIVKKMEADFPLRATRVSKGGIPVDNGMIPGEQGACVPVPMVSLPHDPHDFEEKE